MGYAAQGNAYLDALSSLTRENVEYDSVFDQIFNNSPFFGAVQDRVSYLDGGLFDSEVINLGRSPNSMFYSGAGDFKMAAYDAERRMNWDWKLAHDAVVATGFELLVNDNSDLAIVNLIQSRVDLAAVSLRDMFSRDMYVNNPYGLNSDGTVGNPDSFEGLAVAVDDGTISDTVGGLSRTAFPQLRAMTNYSNALGTTFLPAMQALYAATNLSDDTATGINLTTKGAWNAYWGSLTANERYVVERDGSTMGIKNSGGTKLAFNDAIVVIDPKCPTGVTKPGVVGGPTGGFWYGLNLDFFRFRMHSQRKFTQGEWRQDIGSDAFFMDIWFAGMLECLRPNKQLVSWIQGA